MSGELSPREHEVYKVGDALIEGCTNLRLQLMERTNTTQDDPQSIHELLVACRHTTDQFEIALVKALALRRQAESELALAKAEVEEAEVSSSGEIRKESGMYASAKEKTVEFSLRTLEQRREQRKATEHYQQACYVVETLRLLHKGVDTTRQDIGTRLRAITLTTSLERG
jgi:hypothetical protein